MLEEEDFLPLSGLQHLVYCERRFALVHVESQWADSAATVDGKHVHERVDRVASESRGDVRIARGLWIRSVRLRLSGKADVVEFHRTAGGASSGIVLPGLEGRWSVFPVEYKRGVLRHELAYAVQLCGQAMALEEMLSATVPSGAIYYGATRRREEVSFSTELRQVTLEAARRMQEIAQTAVTPAPVFGPKCGPCSLKDLCLPEELDAAGKASAYLAAIIAESRDEGSS